jgi:hypothetical protein
MIGLTMMAREMMEVTTKQMMEVMMKQKTTEEVLSYKSDYYNSL